MTYFSNKQEHKFKNKSLSPATMFQRQVTEKKEEELLWFLVFMVNHKSHHYGNNMSSLNIKTVEESRGENKGEWGGVPRGDVRMRSTTSPLEV